MGTTKRKRENKVWTSKNEGSAFPRNSKRKQNASLQTKQCA